MVEFRRARKPHLTLSIAPLVDCVFLLLIFFLLSSSFQNPAIPLTLPEARSDAHQERKPVTVTVDREQRLYINAEEVSFAAFPERLRQLMAAEGEHRVVFRGDKSLSYDLVLKVMGMAKQAGAESIDLVHRAEQ